MFGQLLSVRLKAAEKALRDGRMDEAYRLAISPDLRKHRRGVAVLETLVEHFFQRARAHFREDRCAEALSDLDRAEAGGVKTDEIAELRKHVEAVAAELHRKARSQRDLLDAAKQRIERGSLAAGRRMLEGAVDANPNAARLQQDAADRASELASLLSQTASLIEQGQFAAAADRLRRAKSLEAHGENVAATETRLCSLVLENARKAIRDGRVSRAADELACLGTLGDSLPAKREFADVISLVGEAAAALRENRYADARRMAMSLVRLMPDVRWMKDVAKQLDQIDEMNTALNAGPLGDTVAAPVAAAARSASLDETVALPRLGGGADGGLPRRLLLLVDGGGSYLLLREPQAAIGRAACDKPGDVPILSDIAERHANINRVDDDYFFYSGKEAEVAGRKVKHQLLRDGDRVVLGPKAKFTFRLPSRRSATAVLDLSDTTKIAQDVRRVVLFDRHATIGSGRTAHISCRHASPALVLFERSGSLWIRPQNDGHVDQTPVELVLGESTEIGGVTLVLEAWRPRTPGATA